MDANQLIAIISVIVAIVFGIPAYIAIRDKPKTKIFFFRKYQLKLYDNLLKNLPDLEIKYKGRPVQESMFVYKGVFICSGKNDIVASDIQKGITLTIDNDQALWHAGGIVDKTEDLEINTRIDGAKLTIDFPLLKDKDFFALEAFGESSELNVSITHRIREVAKDIEINTAGIEKNVKVKLILALIGLVFSVMVSFIVFNIFFEESLNPTYYNKNKEVINKDEITRNNPGEALNVIIFEQSKIEELRKGNNKLSLILGDKTKFYEVNQQYYATFSVDPEWHGLFLILVMLVIVLIDSFLLIKIGANYNSYRSVASLGTKILG